MPTLTMDTKLREFNLSMRMIAASPSHGVVPAGELNLGESRGRLPWEAGGLHPARR